MDGCTVAADCANPGAPALVDADNYLCVSGACLYVGCLNNSECADAYGSPGSAISSERGWLSWHPEAPRGVGAHSSGRQADAAGMASKRPAAPMPPPMHIVTMA